MKSSFRPLRPAAVSRRRFLQLGGAATALASLPLLLPARLRGADAPSKRLRIGQIGCGRIARVHDLPRTWETGWADLVAVCDVDKRRTDDARQLVEQYYQQAGRAQPSVRGYGNYREMLAEEELDAVIISTPDHWHAEPALAAVRAGKAIYLQKPFTMTLAEGIKLRDAAQTAGVVFQIGSQQRSWEQFRRAAELIRSGRVGAVRRVEIGLPVDPTQPDDPPQPVPANLDFEQWLGPTPRVPYTEQRVHPQNGYDRPGWLRNESYCLGMITGWGSHHYDTLHWALDVENSGPTRVEAQATFPPASHKMWNVHGPYEVQLAYPGGVQVVVSDRFPNGLKFIGDDGWIFVSRDQQATSSDPSVNTGNLQPLDASDPRLLDPNGVSVQLPRSDSHHRNWLEAVRSGGTPLAPPTVAHRSNSACIVSWIAMKLGRPLQWDAAAERFVDDAEANRFLERPERAPYGIGAG